MVDHSGTAVGAFSCRYSYSPSHSPSHPLFLPPSGTPCSPKDAATRRPATSLVHCVLQSRADSQGRGSRHSSTSRSASASRPSSSSASSAQDGSLSTCPAPSSRVRTAARIALTSDFSPAAAHVPDVQQRGWRRLFGWIIPTLRTSDYVVLQTVGLDAAVVRTTAGAECSPQLLSFFFMCFCLFGLFSLLSFFEVIATLILEPDVSTPPARLTPGRGRSQERDGL